MIDTFPQDIGGRFNKGVKFSLGGESALRSELRDTCHLMDPKNGLQAAFMSMISKIEGKILASAPPFGAMYLPLHVVLADRTICGFEPWFRSMQDLFAWVVWRQYTQCLDRFRNRFMGVGHAR